MKSFVLASALAISGALGGSSTASAQVYGYPAPIYPGGGVVYAGGFGYGIGTPVITAGYSPYYSSYYSYGYRPNGYYGGYRGYSRPYYAGYRGGYAVRRWR